MSAAIAASLQDSSPSSASASSADQQTQLEQDEALARAVAASLQESGQKSKVSVWVYACTAIFLTLSPLTPRLPTLPSPPPCRPSRLPSPPTDLGQKSTQQREQTADSCTIV